MVTGMLAVPAVHDAGDTFVMVTGSTSVRDVVWLTTAGLLPRMVAKMLSVAVFDLGRVHTTFSASTIKAKLRNARNTTSSFSKREKMRRNPLIRLKRRSTSFLFL